jgi:hypothetical protein
VLAVQVVGVVPVGLVLADRLRKRTRVTLLALGLQVALVTLAVQVVAVVVPVVRGLSATVTAALVGLTQLPVLRLFMPLVETQIPHLRLDKLTRATVVALTVVLDPSVVTAVAVSLFSQFWQTLLFLFRLVSRRRAYCPAVIEFIR